MPDDVNNKIEPKQKNDGLKDFLDEINTVYFDANNNIRDKISNIMTSVNKLSEPPGYPELISAYNELVTLQNAIKNKNEDHLLLTNKKDAKEYWKAVAKLCDVVSTEDDLGSKFAAKIRLNEVQKIDRISTKAYLTREGTSSGEFVKNLLFLIQHMGLEVKTLDGKKATDPQELMSIASSMVHGGRVFLDCGTEANRNKIFHFLYTGQCGDGLTNILKDTKYVANSYDKPGNNSKISSYRRNGATHGFGFEKEKQSFFKKVKETITSLLSGTKAEKEHGPVVEKKLNHLQAAIQGIRSRLGLNESCTMVGRDLGFGGPENGRNGHAFMMTSDKKGQKHVAMIGFEGSRPGESAFGEKHTFLAKASKYSPTGGFKLPSKSKSTWFDNLLIKLKLKKPKRIVDLGIPLPAKHDGMRVTITDKKMKNFEKEIAGLKNVTSDNLDDFLRAKPGEDISHVINATKKQKLQEQASDVVGNTNIHSNNFGKNNETIIGSSSTIVKEKESVPNQEEYNEDTNTKLFDDGPINNSNTSSTEGEGGFAFNAVKRNNQGKYMDPFDHNINKKSEEIQQKAGYIEPGHITYENQIKTPKNN